MLEMTTKKRKKSYNPIKTLSNYARVNMRDCVVSSVVDLQELVDSRTGSNFVPRTLVYNRIKRKDVRLDVVAAKVLKLHRHNWDVHMAILCRKDNEYYLAEQDGFRCETPVILEELNDYLADTMIDHFQACGGNGLTMLWVASPNDLGTITIDEVLYPLWKYDVLRHIHTHNESTNEDKILVPSFETFDEYVYWFSHQQEYIDEFYQHNGHKPDEEDVESL